MEIAILLPCYNEELTIAKVINDFKKELPNATIYVYDNNSSDKTFDIALSHDAKLCKEYRQGKGSVVRSMFRDIEADIYIIADGDDTYPASFVHTLIKPIIQDRADMVIGDRLSNGSYHQENKRTLHSFGNNLVKNLINKLFKANLSDIMSGYRAFNKKFVKNIPINSDGFEIEAEMTLHALDKKFLLEEVAIDYRDRPDGSYSKLNTYGDGLKVLKTIAWVFKDYKPFAFFGLCSVIFFILALIIGVPIIVEFAQMGLVPKFPSAILATGLMLIATLCLFSGLILDTIAKQNRDYYLLRLKDWLSIDKQLSNK